MHNSILLTSKYGGQDQETEVHYTMQHLTSVITAFYFAMAQCDKDSTISLVVTLWSVVCRKFKVSSKGMKKLSICWIVHCRLDQPKELTSWIMQN